MQYRNLQIWFLRMQFEIISYEVYSEFFHFVRTLNNEMKAKPNFDKFSCDM